MPTCHLVSESDAPVIAGATAGSSLLNARAKPANAPDRYALDAQLRISPMEIPTEIPRHIPAKNQRRVDADALEAGVNPDRVVMVRASLA